MIDKETQKKPKPKRKPVPPRPNGESRVPEHLRPYAFKPGQSGNPGGRPKGRSLGGRLRELMEEKGEDGRSWRERILAALLDLAERGNAPAIREIFNRVDGRILEPQVEEQKRDDPLIVAELMAKQYAPEDES